MTLPLPAAGCRLTVAIPARNEAGQIEACLDALVRQRQPNGDALNAGLYDIIVFANGCDDDTAARARAVAARCAQPLIHVIEAAPPPDAAHIGWARKAVMDLAAARFLESGHRTAIIASTDADTRVALDWIAVTLAEIAGVDAITGHISVSSPELAAFTPELRALHRCDQAYRQVVAELEATLDPLAHDPLPRHAHHFGASFAVTARAYERSGGVPPVPYLEDLAFYRALLRIDAQVRHSPRVRVTTSARRAARVAGGFATFLGDLDARIAQGETLLVEPPERTLRDLRARATLRSLYRGDAATIDLAPLEAWCCAEVVCAALDRRRPFGENLERIERLATRRTEPLEPVAEALSVLRTAFAAQAVTRPRMTGASVRLNALPHR